MNFSKAMYCRILIDTLSDYISNYDADVTFKVHKDHNKYIINPRLSTTSILENMAETYPTKRCHRNYIYDTFSRQCQVTEHIFGIMFGFGMHWNIKSGKWQTYSITIVSML